MGKLLYFQILSDYEVNDEEDVWSVEYNRKTYKAAHPLTLVFLPTRRVVGIVLKERGRRVIGFSAVQWDGLKIYMESYYGGEKRCKDSEKTT